MRVRLIPFGLMLLLLTACEGETGSTVADNHQQQSSTRNASGAPAVPAQLSYKLEELHRQGGPKCPPPPKPGQADAKPSAPTAGEDILCASVKLSYPKMSSVSHPELAEKLNAQIIRQLLDSENGEVGSDELTLDQFAEGFIADYQQDANPFSSWEMAREAKVVFSTVNMVTLLFTEYGYTGGAHPFSGQRYLVMNLQDGEPVVLADLLSPGYETPLNVIGEGVFRQARDLGEADTLEEQGYSFENNVFSLNDNFGVLKEGLDFIFNSYEIAPYAMGPTQFTIPYEDIHSLISPDGYLGDSVR